VHSDGHLHSGFTPSLLIFGIQKVVILQIQQLDERFVVVVLYERIFERHMTWRFVQTFRN
jgi:hypothetical protein